MSEPTPSIAVSMETTACPLCGDERSSIVIASRDLHYECPIEFTAVRCEACRHVFLNPRPTCECIGQFYPTDYGPFRPTAESDRQANSQASQSTSSRRRSKFSPRSWPWLRRLVLWWIDSRAAPIPGVEISNFKSQISNLKSQTSPRALELGCARGAFLQQLRDHGWDCIGIEPSPEVALRAKAGGFDVRVGMLESVVAEDSQTFAPGSFDAIFAWMVVEHLHDPLATLRLARELLKPDGTLSFSVPNFGCWEQPAFGRVWHALDLPRHLQHFTTASLLRLLEAQSPEMVCSVLLLDDDGVHLRHGAGPSLPDEYNRAIDGVTIGPNVGSCGTAAFRGESIIVEYIASDPLWANFKGLALSHGLRACWSTPILDSQQQVLGTFAVYYREPAQPTAL